MEITLDIIMQRRSVRSYSGQVLSPGQVGMLEEAMADEAGRCPFGNRPRFKLATPGLVGESDHAAALKIGTYGVIRNPPAFIAGAVAPGQHSILDYGYALEGLILTATAAGLGTCWLGGTFDRAATKELLALKDGEVIPAITPVGLPAESRSLTERTMRFLARSDSRKPWDKLFFDAESGKPLDVAAAGAWAPVLEAVRMGPSASNKQPWRIIREGTSRFSLMFAEDKAYNSALGIPIQELDLGIAMKHFELAALSFGLTGRWIKDKDRQSNIASKTGGSLAYVASWDV